MHILVAGGSGFLGRALTAALVLAGHTVTILTRRTGLAPAASAVPVMGHDNAERSANARRFVHTTSWAPDGHVGPWADACTGVDVVVNLAGESIATRRWSVARKRALVESRTLSTRSLVGFIEHATHRPSLFVSSSAIGIYGDRHDEALTESAAPGSDFLAGLAQAWEREALLAADASTRVILVRTGIVLDPSEGALAKMLPPFRWFVGGPFGSGRQFMSWIHRDDWVSLLDWCVDSRGLSGPVNAVAPGAVTNAQFARTLGRVLSRPAIAPIPGFVLKTILGEMAGPLLLSSQRVVPAVAEQGGFTFRYPTLEPALRDLLCPPDTSDAEHGTEDRRFTAPASRARS